MRVLIVSSSLDASSRSERLAGIYCDALKDRSCDAHLVSLKDHPLPRFDNSDATGTHASYRSLHTLVSQSDGLVFASPVYNWECCAELKRFVEVIGTTPPARSLVGAFYDKIVTFVNAAGLPHSYMAFAPMALSMMLDFKCIINPYNVYVHDCQWHNIQPIDEVINRINKSAVVMVELMQGLSGRTYRSSWEV